MVQYAAVVSRERCDLAYEVIVENLQAIVDDILDYRDTSTVVFTSEAPPPEIARVLAEYLGPKTVELEAIV
jgi:hypothetical protein